jgi:xanthine/uracil permease
VADEKGRPEKKGTPEELSDLRRSAVYVFLALSVLVVVVDTFGRLFLNSEFRVDSVVFGFIFGTLLALLGLEGLNRALGGK